MQPADPYPTVRLPQQQRSLYEQSAAVIAMKLGGRPLTADQTTAFVNEAMARRDASTGYFVDADSGDPAMVTWYALRGLDAVGALTRVGVAAQTTLLASARKAVGDAKLIKDPFDRIYDFRVVRLLADRGDPSVRLAAAAALAQAGAQVDCASAFSASDVDLWGAAVEMAVDSGVTCRLPSSAPQRLIVELKAAADDVDQAGHFTAFAVERLRTIALIVAGCTGVPRTVADPTASALAGLRSDLSQDQIETNPLAVAVASQLLTDQHLPAAFGPNSAGLLESVLQWGAQLTTYTPNASLFAVIARSLILLPGAPDRTDMVKMVTWADVSGLDRLQLAIALDSTVLRPGDLTSAIDEAAARAHPAGPTPGAGASTDWSAPGLIAQAAAALKAPCTGALATWAAGVYHDMAKQEAHIAVATSGPLLPVVRFLHYARACAAVAAGAGALYQVASARAESLADRVVGGSLDTMDVLDVLASFEAACAADHTIATSASAAAQAAVTRLEGDNAIGLAGDGEQVSVERTYAALRVAQIGQTGCRA